MMRYLLCLLLCLTISHSSFSQVIEKSYLTTDREVYAQDDTLWFKGYVFNQYNQLSDKSIAFHVVLMDELGNKISTTSWPIEYAMAHGNFPLPPQEGKYYLLAYSGQMAGSNTNQAFQKEIHIRSGQADEISLKYLSRNPVYHMDSTLSINVSAQSGSSLQSNLRIDYEVWDNSKIIKSGKTKTNDDGIAEVELKNLAPIDKEFHLLLKVEKSDVRTSQLTIPIRLAKPVIDLQFFPEGGSLVSTLANNVAFKAIDNQGLPIDIKGHLVDKLGNTLASIASFYKGMGQFKFSPETDQEYFFQIDEPKGIDSMYVLPNANSSGILFAIDSVDVSDVLSIRIQSSLDLYGQQAAFEVLKNGAAVGQFNFKLKPKQTIKLPLEQLNVGIYTFKVSNEELTHRSERIFFIKPKAQLHINIETDKSEYKAREKVEGQLTVEDKEGNPIAGDFSISAVYKTRSLIPNSEQPNLMAQILLNSDLKGHIPTPNFYFSKDESAVEALNLVMITNGWRKYGPSKLTDPEAIAGNVSVKGKKSKSFHDTSINMLSIATNNLQSFDLDDQGNFKISSSKFKYSGDSLLLVVNTKSKKLVPNISLNTSYKNLNSTFQESLLKTKLPHMSHDIYLPSFKIVEDKFQGVTMLNPAEVRAKKVPLGNGCSILESESEGWITKTHDELDMTNPELITLLKQINPALTGYGDIHPVNVSTSLPFLKGIGRIKIAKNAILSTHFTRATWFADPPPRTEWQTKFELALPFELCINCDCGDPPFGISELLEPLPVLLRRLGTRALPYYPFLMPKSLDLDNLESISIRDSKTRPIILIQTKNKIINRKILINRHLNIVAYKNRPDEFYTPVYETKVQIEDVIPDTRDILMWKHSLMTGENGIAKFSFYNADRPQIIQITVEGIAANGQLGVSQIEYRMLDEKVTFKN